MGRKFSGRRPENQPVYTKPSQLDFERRRIFFISPSQSQMQMSFLKLMDTPDSYAGQAGKVTRVNSAESELEFGDVDYGLSFEGTVTTYTDTTHFASTGLIGKGNGYFIGYYVYVVRDSGGAGAAPQGEWRLISGYTSATGTFTHVAFSTPLAAGDKVLIQHPSLDTYCIDGVYFDSVNGVAGTAWPIGTAMMPVNNYADLKTIVTARKLSKVNVSGFLIFASDWLVDKQYIFEGHHVYGTDDDIDIASYNVGFITFKYLYVHNSTQNLASNGLTFDKCTIGHLGEACSTDVNLGEVRDSVIRVDSHIFVNVAAFRNCIFEDGVTIYARSEYVRLTNCKLEGILSIGNCEDGITLDTHGGELKITDEFEYYGDAYIYGDSKVTDSAAGRVTINDYSNHKAGKTATFTKNITSAANAGDITVATVKNGTCLIKSVILRAKGVTTADLTSAGIFGGASKVVTFLSATDAITANINAVDEQVSWAGAVTLKTDKTIVISLVGTGATAVNLDVDIEYKAITDAAYLA